MIQERGRVIAVDSGSVQVEMLRHSTCSGCSVSAGCGQGLLRQLGVVRRRGAMRVMFSLALAPGDEVVLGMDEGLLLKSAQIGRAHV